MRGLRVLRSLGGIWGVREEGGGVEGCWKGENGGRVLGMGTGCRGILPRRVFGLRISFLLGGG